MPSPPTLQLQGDGHAAARKQRYHLTTVLLSLPLTATSYTGPACAGMDATAEPTADAGSNTHTQPSQLLLYLRRAVTHSHGAWLQGGAHSSALETRL